MFLKIHKSYRDVVAICDSELIGKKFEQDNFQLDIKENFFKGEELNEKELEKKMEEYFKEDATFNIIGEKSINTAIKANIINKQGIKKIQNIPFAMILG
jgi:uncharacterized protein